MREPMAHVRVMLCWGKDVEADGATLHAAHSQPGQVGSHGRSASQSPLSAPKTPDLGMVASSSTGLQRGHQ